MHNTIYLVGQISERKQETVTWRRIFINYFIPLKPKEKYNYYGWDDYNSLCIIDPTGGEWETDKNPLYPILDRNYVEEANIIVYNSIQYDPEKPLIGSMFELAWAKEDPTKVVVGISDNKDNNYYIHPFIKSTVHKWFETEVSAAEYIQKYVIKNRKD